MTTNANKASMAANTILDIRLLRGVLGLAAAIPGAVVPAEDASATNGKFSRIQNSDRVKYASTG